MQKIKSYIIKNKTNVTIAIIWSIGTLLWYCIYGFKYDLEGEKYRIQADYFLQNYNFEQKRHLFYSTTILIIALCKALKLKIFVAILLLLLFNLYAYLKFSKALLLFFNSKFIAFGCTTFLIFFPPFQSWTMYLFTENIFYSLILLLIATLLNSTSITLKNITTIFIISIMLLFSRPLGILFIFPILLFYTILANKKQRYFILLSTIISTIVFYSISQIVFTTTPDWTVQRSFVEENLICDMPTTNVSSNLDLINDKSQLKVLFYYITHNFSHFLPLALKRLQLFYFNYRQYYSTFHNLYLIVFLGIMYSIIIIRFKYIYNRMPKSLFWFMISLICLFSITVAFQCDDYHNRFFMSLMPCWIILVAFAIKTTFFDKLRKN